MIMMKSSKIIARMAKAVPSNEDADLDDSDDDLNDREGVVREQPLEKGETKLKGNCFSGWVTSKRFERWVILEGARMADEVEYTQVKPRKELKIR